MSEKTTHYAGEDHKEEGWTYCGHPYIIREFPDMRHRPLFSATKSQVTCKKCQKKLKEDEQLQKSLMKYYKKIENEIPDSDDNFIMGYFEAISNMLGEFGNGMCADCPFCFETSGVDFESQQPEAILHCSLDKCWIDEVKRIIRNKKE